MNWITRMTLAITAFREAYVTADTLTNAPFESHAGRLVRYDILWSWYENTAYRDIHKWAEAYRAEYGLYKYVRNIYNPTYRLVEFWKTVIWGGLLDPEAGEDGAIPILTDNENLRPAIATLFGDSNWDINKDVLVGYAGSMGDGGIKICDYPEAGQMRLEVIHPSSIKSLTLDNNKYVKGYVIEEIRLIGDKEYKYREEAVHEPGSKVVTYKTYKDDDLFKWNGRQAMWTEPYDFVPLVMFQHNHVGGNFGWAEIHPLRSKVNDLEDLAAKLHDYIRKVVDPIWLFNFAQPRKPIEIVSGEKTSNRLQPGREENNAIYVPNVAAKAFALVSSDLDVEKVGKAIERLIAEMERDFPELQMDIWTAGGYTTGKALKTARQRVERKVIQRRPNYDRGLERAIKMALTIGARNKYKGYTDLNPEGYAEGEFDFKIPSDRPIFDSDSSVEIQDKQIFWNIVTQAKDKGIPIELILKDLGWSKSKIKIFMKEYNAALEKEKELAKETPPSDTSTTDPSNNSLLDTTTQVIPADDVTSSQ